MAQKKETLTLDSHTVDTAVAALHRVASMYEEKIEVEKDEASKEFYHKQQARYAAAASAILCALAPPK